MTVRDGEDMPLPRRSAATAPRAIMRNTRDCLAFAQRVTSRGMADFMFTFGTSATVRYWSIPPIASGRITRGRLASYWLDGFTLVPMEFIGHRVPDNAPHAPVQKSKDTCLRGR